MRQIVLNSVRVRDLMAGRFPYEIAAASGKLTSNAVRRVMNGRPVTPTIATHVAEALGVDLEDLVVREVDEPLPPRNA